jgi:hypothetical protein
MASSRSLHSRILRLTQVNAIERRAAASAAVLLPATAIALRAGGMRRARAASTALARVLPPIDAQLDARRVAVVVGAVADAFNDHTFVKLACLPRSLALLALLERRGQQAELRLGVRKLPDALDAHAWVELAGEVLNDQPTVDERYARLELSET